jgi:hypothetical protein
MTLLHKKLLLQNPKKWKPNGLIQDKSGRIFQGKLWLKKGSVANDDAECKFIY